MNKPEIITIVYQEGQAFRLDKYLTTIFSKFSRSYIQKLIKEQCCLVNLQAVPAKYPLKNGDTIIITIPPIRTVDIIPISMPLNILYEDNCIIVLDKKAGIAVHPSHGVNEPTLVHGLLAHCGTLSSINGEFRPGIVHRLDKQTSGILLIAKNDLAHHSLSEQFSKKEIVKIYYALVNGHPNPSKGIIQTLYGRHPTRPMLFSSKVEKGKEAITEYFVEKWIGNFSWVKVKLHTGRTHQIRVHFSDMKHPVIGDQTYGNHQTKALFHRQILHAHEITFIHPQSDERMTFVSPIPDDISQFLKTIS